MRLLGWTLALASGLSFAVQRRPANNLCDFDLWGFNRSADVIDERSGEIGPKENLFKIQSWDASAGFDGILFSRFGLFKANIPDLSKASVKLIIEATSQAGKNTSTTNFKVEYWDKNQSFIQLKEFDLGRELSKFPGAQKRGRLEFYFGNKMLCNKPVEFTPEGSGSGN
jgi:hypothetical protein